MIVFELVVKIDNKHKNISISTIYSILGVLVQNVEVVVKQFIIKISYVKHVTRCTICDALLAAYATNSYQLAKYFICNLVTIV